MTDGVQHLAIAYPTNEPYPRLFGPLFEYADTHTHLDAETRAADLNAFLDSDAVNAETDDDKTLVLAVRVPGGHVVSDAR